MLMPLVFAIEHPGLTIAGLCGIVVVGFARRSQINQSTPG
jgi:hypothetical protein